MTEEQAPEKIEIRGIEKNLNAILDSFVGNWKVRAHNRSAYRNAWEKFLPSEVFDPGKKQVEIVHKPWSMAYVPRITIRKAMMNDLPDGFQFSKTTNIPYFIVVLNSGRDTRPQKQLPPGRDLLQENVIDKGMILSEIDNFYLCPNGFPYHDYASLLISKTKRSQGEFVRTKINGEEVSIAKPGQNITPDDISEWMKFAFLTGQYVFFNSPNAGASRAERLHAQVVDPEVMSFEGRQLTYPMMNESLVRRTHVKEGIWELKDYPLEALIFEGRDAPHQASRLTMKLAGVGSPYNIMTDGHKVYVIARNKERERSDCIGKNIGGYECTGVILVGNVEEPVLGGAGLEKTIHANEVFNALPYEVLCSNIGAAGVPINWMKDLL